MVDKHTGLRVNVVKGKPSSVFHILAEPSVDVETKNSESRLESERKAKLGVIRCHIDSQTLNLNTIIGK